MLPFLRGATARAPTTLPLFPLKTVLFPGGMLPLKVFEQRYIEMTKSCLKDEKPFGVCLLNRGEEVARPDAIGEFAGIGTMARITQCDVPQLGILHLKTEGGTRFQVQSHSVNHDGLVVGQVTAIAPEPTLPLPEAYQPLAALLELLVERVGREHFAGETATGDASWVGYRLAELLPLPLAIKQSMLEINDSEVRLKVLAQFLKDQEIL
ncbi:MAG: LON peptidase substrate-binding domain-containing protein [Casimicrobiaceae bacterium]